MSTSATSPSETFEIVDGVRRTKAAHMVGQTALPARIDDGTGALGQVVNLPIGVLRSPKETVDISSIAKFQRFKKVLDKARGGLTPPPITVIRGSQGKPITDVEFDL